ncbi:NADPH-dependent FMN reductase [Corynebacterium mendelii]|uniref:NAD(P)H-dependent oxidoreductase n=1 Tax=Corynebacterium mendelii TaxID=2765362 RepID=A0A939DZ87_9CORY|nr:NADPH-dependent FMN reductase [Corynebacterium mendelii]MBN9643975.1 NAD(P)H-dependent oxidoreductase [Corynebacterium mendelii]
MAKNIAVIVGSLRRESIARKIATNVLEMFPEGYNAEIVEIRDLPLYDCDYDDPNVADKPVPQEYTDFRNKIKQCAGVLFVTAENNRAIPACVKNVVDIGSKPADDAVWKNLPLGIMSHSVGKMGGYSSQKILRLTLSYFDMPTPGMPEVFLGQSPQYLDDNDRITPQKTVDFLQDYVTRFVKVVEDNS